MSSELRAAVYQRILTDNIVGLDLEENDTTRWHDREIQAVKGAEGSSVISHRGISHDGTIVGSTLSLGNSLDEKIISLANVFRLLYQKRRYELEDTPLWWNWKHGNVQMRIALERMQRWAASTRPIDVIVLMRYAMTTFYVLADEGGCKGGKELIFDMNAIEEYQKEEKRQEKELGNAPYGSETPFAIGIAELLQQIDNTTLPQPFVFPAEDIQFTIAWQRKTPTIKADLNDEQTKRLNELKTRNETSTLTLEEKCELFFYGGGDVNVEELRSSLEEELKKDNLDMERRNTLSRCLFQVISYLGKQQRDYGTELFVDISEDGSRVQPMRTLQKILEKVGEKLGLEEIPLKEGLKVTLLDGKSADGKSGIVQGVTQSNRNKSLQVEVKVFNISRLGLGYEIKQLKGGEVKEDSRTEGGDNDSVARQMNWVATWYNELLSGEEVNPEQVGGLTARVYSRVNNPDASKVEDVLKNVVSGYSDKTPFTETFQNNEPN